MLIQLKRNQDTKCNCNNAEDESIRFQNNHKKIIFALLELMFKTDLIAFP